MRVLPVQYGTDIYLLGGSSGSTTAYKYDTLTNTYTQLANIPYSFYSGCAAGIDNNVYLFGGYESQTNVYKYNTKTDEYTQLANIPYNFYGGSIISYRTDVYLFGTYTSSYQNYAYKCNITDFQNKEIVVQNKEAFKVNLTKQLQTYFNNAFIYDDNELKPYPCYYGDGTQWNLIEKAS